MSRVRRRGRCRPKSVSTRYYSEWTAFRYGETRTSRLKPILKGNKRSHVVTETAKVLADFDLTPFEHEAACYHGLRAGLCLDGHAWAEADADAFAIVQEALKKNAAVRPSWEQGQREYTTPRENCSWCGGELGGDSATRFCSAHCAKMAITRRSYEGLARENRARVQALRLVNQSRKTPRSCEECGKAFLHNGEKDPAKFCSHHCYAVHKAKTEPSLERECRTCGDSFRAKDERAIFCSTACQTLESRMRRGTMIPVKGSARVFDYLFTRPINMRPDELTPERLDQLIAAL